MRDSSRVGLAVVSMKQVKTAEMLRNTSTTRKRVNLLSCQEIHSLMLRARIVASDRAKLIFAAT